MAVTTFNMHVNTVEPIKPSHCLAHITSTVGNDDVAPVVMATSSIATVSIVTLLILLPPSP